MNLPVGFSITLVGVGRAVAMNGMAGTLRAGKLRQLTTFDAAELDPMRSGVEIPPVLHFLSRLGSIPAARIESGPEGMGPGGCANVKTGIES